MPTIDEINEESRREQAPFKKLQDQIDNLSEQINVFNKESIDTNIIVKKTLNSWLEKNGERIVKEYVNEFQPSEYMKMKFKENKDEIARVKQFYDTRVDGWYDTRITELRTAIHLIANWTLLGKAPKGLDEFMVHKEILKLLQIFKEGSGGGKEKLEPLLQQKLREGKEAIEELKRKEKLPEQAFFFQNFIPIEGKWYHLQVHLSKDKAQIYVDNVEVYPYDSTGYVDFKTNGLSWDANYKVGKDLGREKMGGDAGLDHPNKIECKLTSNSKRSEPCNKRDVCLGYTTYSPLCNEHPQDCEMNKPKEKPKLRRTKEGFLVELPEPTVKTEKIIDCMTNEEFEIQLNNIRNTRIGTAVNMLKGLILRERRLVKKELNEAFIKKLKNVNWDAICNWGIPVSIQQIIEEYEAK